MNKENIKSLLFGALFAGTLFTVVATGTFLFLSKIIAGSESIDVGGRTFIPRADRLVPPSGTTDGQILEWDTTTNEFIAVNQSAGGTANSDAVIPFPNKTLQDPSGDTMATGTISLLKDPSLLGGGDTIEISDGAGVSTTITFINFGGGSTSYSGGTLSVDVGGGMGLNDVVAEIMWGWSKVVAATSTTIHPFCTTNSATGSGSSDRSSCVNLLADGTATTTVMYFYNANGGVAGNTPIIVGGNAFDAEGMTGGE